ncbi:hypothetical protein EXIGLDRAFT_451550 [Exidia glandulosa HHB12029]|uniref:Uncharacterized protein n=1 Tax=Exidia glandulosa HHB12029 TaxID=1314781 RepID=A0A165B3J1_EXIGL|nr:hypothetical protein EXIGLDRAFT_451550 [Exidia glandulosa HHB12029]
MAVSIVKYPAEMVLRALDSCPPLSKDVFELQTSLGDDIFACVSVIELCPSLRHLTIFNAATSISRLNASMPYNITHFTYIQAGSLPLDDLFALFQHLPALQRLTFQFLSMVHTISPECSIYTEDHSFAVPPFKLRHYAVGHAFTASHLPILCSQSSLRSLWIRSPLSPAFDQPSIIYENVAPARRVAIIREARQLFDAAVLVAPNLEELYLIANRMTQAFDNPEPSHLPNLLPLFAALRALKRLRLQLQLDEDDEVEELASIGENRPRSGALRTLPTCRSVRTKVPLSGASGAASQSSGAVRSVSGARWEQQHETSSWAYNENKFTFLADG